ncbi:MAG: transposase [Clostridiaceae bacterium BRH_c20a]|nr:MAG: transposase [Clostridiaceae bacterium BRH_c20a]
MPRRAREKSETGIYHIMIRGANRQEIFHDDKDRLRFLDTLNKVKTTSKMQVYGWCLMNNHVHLLLEEGSEEISISMKRLGVSFVWYYNQKYKTTGHLFQDRFKSENVESDKYLLTVIRYIHQNPVKVQLVKRVEQWRWSSCRGYYGDKVYPRSLLDNELVLKMFFEDESKAMEKFKQFNEQETNDSCLDDIINEKVKLSDEEARLEVLKVIDGIEIAQVKSLPKKERDQILQKVKGIEKITQRQAARILGVSPNLIFKA